MAEHPEISSESTHRSDPHSFAHIAAESERKRQEIINDVARAAGPNDDVDWLTKRELYRAGLISASELHTTGSHELLPKGWYEYYVEALGEYCLARVFSREEAGADAASLYDRGHRWMVVFSEVTGPRGDRTFIDVRSFGAAAMTENGPIDEVDALSELTHMGYQTTDLPRDVFMAQRPSSTSLPGEGWYADPTRRFQHRWWDGKHWTHAVATNGQTFSDPLA